MDAAVRDVVVVGSGAGGARLALELARRGRSVTVLERGSAPRGLGTFAHAARFYDAAPLVHLPRRSREGVVLWRALTCGGSTVAACGNLSRSLTAGLAALGIDLEADLVAVERELEVGLWPRARLSRGGRLLEAAAAEVGTPLSPMPKAIDTGRCSSCGMCVLGCATGAKWSAASTLDHAVELGAEVLTGREVTEVVVRGGRAAGVRGRGPEGGFELASGTVVLAAGGLATPRLLRRAGVEGAGPNLFADLFVNVYGVLGGVRSGARSGARSGTRSGLPSAVRPGPRPRGRGAGGVGSEPVMAMVHLGSREERGFILSPFVNRPGRVRLLEAGPRGAALPIGRTLGIMVKTTDDGAGEVPAHGRVSKPVTPADGERLAAGTAAARRILEAAGVSPRSVVVSRVQGAHPGGTAAVGRVVDEGHRTRVPGLLVCDASVLPAAPGLPPILTITALARRLAREMTA